MVPLVTEVSFIENDFMRPGKPPEPGRPEQPLKVLSNLQCYWNCGPDSTRVTILALSPMAPGEVITRN